jgi:DNA (cytosine-5)-methyltransferase 1
MIEAVSPHFAKPILPAGAGLRVLSLFDGMSCGQQALERIGVNVLEYYASEIDKHAIAVTMHNYPNTKQLGSVIDVDGYKLPKIDLLIGGSPCQSFSFAGKRKGMATTDEQEILTLEHYLELKADGYEFEGQSYLFWEFMRLLYEVKPKYFLLENVEMGEKWERVLTQAIGVNALHINSALVSAQNRKRIYFTNIGMEAAGLFGYPVSIIQKPKDRKILLKDILESEVDEKYFLSEKMIQCLDSKKGTTYDTFYPADINNKGRTINSRMAKMGSGDNYIVHNTMPRSSTTGKGGTGHLSRNDGKTYCLDTGNTNAVEVREVRQLSTNNKSNGGTQPYQQDRIYDVNGISPALSAGKSDLMITSGTLRTHKDGEGFREVQSGKGATIPARAREDGSGQNVVAVNSRIRRLTPLECQRLQTVNDNYNMPVSDSQKYKMLGNGWTIEVISHIFKYIL